MLGSHASRSAISDRLPAFVITALLAASGVVLATLAEGGVAMAQDDACSLITTEELMRITATSEVEISPDGDACDWYATTPEFEAVSVELLLDAGDAAAYASEYPEAEQIEIAGASGYQVRLDDDFAFDVTASGAAGDLGEELKGAFAGAEVGHVEGEIGVDDSDERDVREVQSLRDHLRADEDIDLAGTKGA